MTRSRALADDWVNDMREEWRPRVTVVSAFRYHLFELAHQLDTRHLLTRLVTAMPKRAVSEVPPARVTSRPALAVAHHLTQRVAHVHSAQLNRLVIKDFDRWASTRITESDVIVGLSGFATGALLAAGSAGQRTVCDRGAWHILEQKRVLDEEADRWGWPHVAFDPWIIERELTEYDVADRIFVPSEPARLSFLKHGISSAKIIKIPYGVNAERFTPVGRGDGLRIISVATIGLTKGQQYLVPAYRRVRRSGTELVLVGAATRTAVRRLGIVDDDIKVTGAVPRAKVAEQLRRSGIFVLASVQEGFALVIAQAMACGLPVVATYATGAAELITHGQEGLLVPPGDEDKLAAALDELLADPGRAQAMGEAARRRISAARGWGTYGDLAAQELRRIACEPDPS